MNAFLFVALWTWRWQQVASVFGVCLGERCGLWLDVSSVRLGVAVQVGRNHECRVSEWRLRFWTSSHSLTLVFGSFGSHTRHDSYFATTDTTWNGADVFADGWWLRRWVADDVMWRLQDVGECLSFVELW